MDCNLSCIFILIICTNTVITAETHHKRSPQGFQGVRGKRSIERLSSQDKQEFLENSNQIVTTTTTTTETSFKNDDVKDPKLLRDLSPISVVKRAPMGFMGMRGKKENSYEYEDNILEHNPEEQYLLQNYPPRYISKRAPSGFMGMRGKRVYDDYNDWDMIKRAPSGFLGMRGKKETDDVLHQLVELYEADDLDTNLLQNLQHEKELLNDVLSLEQVPNYVYKDNDKRAPSSGFFGMRGKKSIPHDIAFNSINKRAPSPGFFGMRGKKWMDDDDLTMSEEKRAPMGFQGMRGKKDVSADIDNEFSEEKRAPTPGFFGMRGKKGPIGAGFFGSRGKKGPFEFRGKFVGVRGKKIPPGSLRRLAMDLGGDLDMADLQPAALVDDFESNKRGPSGFMGMRGKKWTDAASDK